MTSSESEGDQQPCPRCPLSPDLDADCYESWLQCDSCDMWYHSICVGLGEEEANRIDVFHCPACHDKHGPSTYKRSSLRRSSRPHAQVDYSLLDEGEPAIFNQYTLRLEAREFEEANLVHLDNGEALKRAWLLDYCSEDGRPFIVDDPRGLGMRMPPPDITVSEIARKVGRLSTCVPGRSE
ncbi:JmjC domain-containing histone demethylation protein 1 [Spiromyces aspiralis]|uniref:JmjC domain-containing histone demethylation protein 1 n=1 Tax=Spiromyces aspiralis TaxID=68401 RepID=A0ACC1HE94_9FUNG|nr:JmjC domain-containing histone demethylation protein 1 [Spiromyces aspiralis]